MIVFEIKVSGHNGTRSTAQPRYVYTYVYNTRVSIKSLKKTRLHAIYLSFFTSAL